MHQQNCFLILIVLQIGQLDSRAEMLHVLQFCFFLLGAVLFFCMIVAGQI